MFHIALTTLTSSAHSGELRPIAPSYLTTILEALLNTLVSHSLPHTDAPLTSLLVALEEDHEVRRDVTRQILGWFGRINEGELGSTWEMDVAAVVREVGLGILRTYKVGMDSLRTSFA